MVFLGTFIIIPSYATNGNTVTVEYTIKIYTSQEKYYMDSYSAIHYLRVTFVNKNNSYMVSDIVYEKGSPSILAWNALQATINYPSREHFALDPSILKTATLKKEVNIDGYKIVYEGKDAIVFGKNRIEDGVLVVLVLENGGKEVLYDEETGILLKEFFVVTTGPPSIGKKYFVSVIISEGPSFLGDEGINRWNIKFFQAISFIITVFAIAAFSQRNRYRIL